MLSRLLRCALAFALLCSLTHAIAQSYIYDAGSPSYGVNIPIENGFINVTNGNLHMEFPLAQHPQRGQLTLNERLVYDSHFWKIGHYSNYYWWPDNVPRTAQLAAGWRFESGGDTGSIATNVASYSETDCEDDKNPDDGTIDTDVLTFSWTDPNGTAHPFSTSFYYSYSNCSIRSQPNPETQTGVATDSSGYTLTVTGDDQSGPQSYSIRDNNGTQVYPQIVDRYGNFWTTDSSGNLVDDRGQTPVVVSYSGNQIYYDVLRQGGGRARYTVTTVQVTPHTQFNQQGGFVQEYPNGNNAVTLNAVQSIQLPDNTTYQFQYENTFGMITGVTLPTGGQLTYGWSNYTDSYNNVNRWLTSRTAGSDPASTFTPAVVSTCGSNQQTCHEQVNVHEPLGDETLYDMQLCFGAWNTNTKRYAGSVSNGTLVSSTDTAYNNLPTSSCPGTGFITSQNVTTTLADTGYKRTDVYTYANNQLGLLSAKQMYDFYSGSLPSQPLQQTQYTYANNGIPADLSRLGQTDGVGNYISFKQYTYTTSAQSTSGLAGHNLSQSLGVYTQSVADWVNTDGSYITTTLAMDDAGAMLNSTDPNGTTVFGHDGTDAFVTSVTPPVTVSGANLTTRTNYDPYTGVLMSSTDANNQTVTYKSFDDENRPGEIDHPDGGIFGINYYTSPKTTSYYAANSSVGWTINSYDSFGRINRLNVATGIASNPWYMTDTCYDANGRISFEALTIQGSFSNGPVCSGAGIAYSYDTLGRPTTITNSDGTVQYSYRGRATSVTDVNGKQTISQIDGLGRLTAICEVTSQSVVGGTPQPCNLDISATGYLTTYGYDLVNHATAVSQGQQTRTFKTDSLGRSTYTAEPEGGVTLYAYAYNSTGLEVTRNRPSANPYPLHPTTNTYTQYDPVGRTASVTYDDGITPNKTFYYDGYGSLGFNGATSNLNGRLSGTTTTGNTRSQYSYDSAGNVITLWQCAPSVCGTSAQASRTESFTYDYAGALASESDPVSGTIQYTRTPAGEITSITNATYDGAGNTPSPAYSLVSNVANSPFGPTSWLLGNGLDGVKAYDNMGRNSGHWVCNNTTAIGCANGGLRFGAATAFKGAQSQSMCDTVLNQCQNHGYDDFNRLTSVSYFANSGGGTTPPGNFSYTYDRWGNRTSQTGSPSVSYSIDPATNHNTSFGYDAAGNQTNDVAHSYTYDAEGKVVNVDGGSTAAYTYDALDQRVRVTTQSQNVEYNYDAFGKRISTWNVATNTGTHARIYWDGVQVAWRGYGAQTMYDHPNWLGTERMRTNYQGNTIGGLHSLSFGDGFYQDAIVAGGADDNNQFTGQDHDAETGTDHFQYRQYSSAEGRWMSPDPYSGSYDLSNPQSMNRYSYVMNMPLSASDPSGLIVCPSGTVADICTGTSACVITCNVFLKVVIVAATLATSLLFKPSFSGSLDPRAKDLDKGCSVSASSLDKYLGTQHSPMVGQGANLMTSGAKYDIDPRLFVSLAGAESRFGINITAGQFNAFNVLYHGHNSPFDSYKSAINSVGHSLTNPRLGYDLTNTATLYGTYCSGAACPAGLKNVNTFMHQQEANTSALHYPCKKE